MEYDEVGKLVDKLEKDFEGIRSCKKMIENMDPDITLQQLRDIKLKLKSKGNKQTNKSD